MAKIKIDVAELATMREAAAEEALRLESMQERMAELELALEDTGWIRMIMTGDQEFSRSGLRTICALARLMYLKNPLIQRGANVQAYYVFGQGVSIASSNGDVDAVLQSFLKDPKNQAELTSHQSRMGKEVELQVESNLFFTFFTNTVTGHVRIRTIPFDEIDDILSNPEDRKENWYYKRVWLQDDLDVTTGAMASQSKIAYYPDWRYIPKEGDRLKEIGGAPVEWETPVYHVKTGGLPSMKFGVSEVYPQLDWARAYKEFLENWSTIVKAYARFAWGLTTKGGASGVATAKAKLQSTLGTGASENNPPPLTGSTFISTEGVNMQPIRTAGATTAAEDGRRLLLMICAGSGLPESFYGDVSVGTLATAKSLDRPTELMMASRQTLWADIYRDILEYVIAKAIEAQKLDGKIETDEDDVRTIRLEGDEVLSVDVTFPPILEHDVDAIVSSIAQAATLDGKTLAGTIDLETTSRLLLSALGVEGADELIDKMFPKEAPAITRQAIAETLAEVKKLIRVGSS